MSDVIRKMENEIERLTKRIELEGECMYQIRLKRTGYVPYWNVQQYEEQMKFSRSAHERASAKRSILRKSLMDLKRSNKR